MLLVPLLTMTMMMQCKNESSRCRPSGVSGRAANGAGFPQPLLVSSTHTHTAILFSFEVKFDSRFDCMEIRPLRDDDESAREASTGALHHAGILF